MEAVIPIRMLLAHPSGAVRTQARQVLNAQNQIRLVGEAVDEAELWRASGELRPDIIVTADQFRATHGKAQPGGPLTQRLIQRIPHVRLVVIANDVAGSMRALAEGAAAAVTVTDLAQRLLPALAQLLRLDRRGNGQPAIPASAAAPMADHHAAGAPAPRLMAASNRRAVYVLGLEAFFNARHFVVMDGRTGPVHSHSFRVTVKIRQAIQPGQAYGLGFGEVRELVQGETNQLNDKLLNQLPPFNSGADIQPTTENLAAVLYQRVCQKLPANMSLDSITVWESPTNYVTYLEEPE